VWSSMLNHCRLLGNNGIGWARALLLPGVLLFPTVARPSPQTAATSQIAGFVNGQGHKVYLNAHELDPLFRIWDSHRALMRRNSELTGLIHQAARRHRVDPDLVHAIVSVESGYDVRAVSPKGALGLMQLVPATARRFGVDDPFDPKQNVEGGT